MKNPKFFDEVVKKVKPDNVVSIHEQQVPKKVHQQWLLLRKISQPKTHIKDQKP